MATRMNNFMVEINPNDSIRFISVYNCKRGNETKRHILTMVFSVLENAETVMGWKDVLNFFVVHVIDKFFLPLQSVNVTWQSLRIVKSGTPQRHPLNIKGKVNQEIGTLDKGLKIELQRAYAKQPSFTYLYGMPVNLQELEQKNSLFEQLEELYLDPIGDSSTMVVQYRGGSSRIYGNTSRFVSCTVRGELAERRKYKSKRKKTLYIQNPNTIYNQS